MFIVAIATTEKFPCMNKHHSCAIPNMIDPSFPTGTQGLSC